MRNPFDLQNNDDEFVAAATQSKRSRQTQITRLCVARSWTLVSSILLALMIALTPLIDDLNNVALTGMAFAATIAGFVHLDLQIKFLKVLEGANSLPTLESLEQTASANDA